MKADPLFFNLFQQKKTSSEPHLLPDKPPARCRLLIKTVKVTDAAPVEFMGKNDLFFELSYGRMKFKSITQDNIGANATWELDEKVVDVFLVSELKNLKLEFKLWDENSTRSNTLIGTSELVDMSKLLESPDTLKSFPFKVQDGKKKVTGSVVVTAIVSTVD